MSTGPEMDDNVFDYSLHYKTWHDDSPEHVAGMMQFHRDQLEPFLPPPGSSPVLDIGCGMGFALLTLRQLGFSSLYGIDSDAEQVKICERFGLPVEQVADTISYLRSHPEKFKIVLLLDVLEHVPVVDQIRFMRAVYRAMEPGGRVILQVPNAASIMASWQRYIDFTHHTSFTPISLRFVLKNAGFDDINIPGQGPLRRPPLGLWRRSARSALRVWLIRYLWRHVLMVEIGRWARIDDIPSELDMRAVAFKSDRLRIE
jgi:SAM-dependent methyltransferase